MAGITKPQPTVYTEKTYRLTLTPVVVSQHHDPRPLTERVTEVMKDRKIDVPPKKAKTVRHQIAHSLMERPDQKSSMHIKLPLARAHGLVKNIEERLRALTAGCAKPINVTPLAELIFRECKSEDEFDYLLTANLNHIRDPKIAQALFDEVVKIRRELRQLMDGKMQYYRPTRSNTHASSYDRTNPDVQNGRMNLDGKKHVIYSTGRIETEGKAAQVLYPLVQQTLTSGQVRVADLIPEADGSYLYPIMLENLINSTPFVRDERKYLLQQEQVLQALSGTHITVIDPTTQQEVRMKLKLMRFSTQTNYNDFLGQAHRFSSTGSDLAESITDEGTKALEEYYNLLGFKTPVLDECFAKLKKCTNLQDRLVLRAFIAELLNIPYHVNCKGSKDRTAAVVALKKGLHQFLKLERWKSPRRFKIPDPLTLVASSVFREYSEAALFENLPMTDQGVGISGELDGKIYTQNRGFNYQTSLLEHPFPPLVLSDRYLHRASIVERVLKAAVVSVATLVLTPLYFALTPIILVVLHHKYKDDYWEAYKYLTLAFFLLPIQSAFRGKWLDRSSPILKERRFFKTKYKPEIAPELKQLYSDVKKGKAVDPQILEDNWRIIENDEAAPALVKAMIKPIAFKARLADPVENFDDLVLHHLEEFTTLEVARDLFASHHDNFPFLVSYLKVFEDAEFMRLVDLSALAKQPFNRSKFFQLIQPLLQREYSSVLKTALRPLHYQQLCVGYELDPMAPLVPALDGSFPKDQFSKEMKYSYFFANMLRHLQDAKLDLPEESDEPLIAKCIQIQDIICSPEGYKNARLQYHAFVEALREAIDLAKNYDSSNEYVQWLNGIALARFADIDLREYCVGLVQTVSGDLDTPLTLDNFWDEFQRRNGRIKKMPSKYKFSSFVNWLQKFRSHANVDFDPLARSNVPYIYGPVTTLREHRVVALRHGAPVRHNDPRGLIERLFKSKRAPKVPPVTSDYLAFAGQDKTILHIILENGDQERADESARVRARLGIPGENFHKMALRMNGKFVDPKEFSGLSMDRMKARFKAELKGPFEKTKFSLPAAVEDKDEFIDAAMKVVQETYFRDTNYFYTKEEYQAFIFLTYAEMTLTLCEELRIDYLEAACKDDIDRGGAFKAILTLHALRQRGELTPKALEEIMVNLVAAPLIVAKRAIIPSRGLFVKNVIDVMRRAYP